MAALHHQFFLRLRTDYFSLQTLSLQFGIQLKDLKNQTNSLYKLEYLGNPFYASSDGTINAEPKFKIDIRGPRTKEERLQNTVTLRRSKSVNDFIGFEFVNVDSQNKENEHCSQKIDCLPTADSKYLPGVSIGCLIEKRRGVKMGTRAFSHLETRVSRSMEAVNTNDDFEDLSLPSVSRCGSSNSMSKLRGPSDNAYVLGKFKLIKTCRFLRK